jgi:hypothetical protein
MEAGVKVRVAKGMEGGLWGMTVYGWGRASSLDRPRQGEKPACQNGPGGLKGGAPRG